MNVFLSKTVS